MQASKVKKIGNQTKNEQTIKFWDDKNKDITQNSTSTAFYHRQTRRKNIYSVEAKLI